MSNRTEKEPGQAGTLGTGKPKVLLEGGSPTPLLEIWQMVHRDGIDLVPGPLVRTGRAYSGVSGIGPTLLRALVRQVLQPYSRHSS